MPYIVKFSVHFKDVFAVMNIGEDINNQWKCIFMFGDWSGMVSISFKNVHWQK
jgi:hypothetical protein